MTSITKKWKKIVWGDLDISKEDQEKRYCEGWIKQLGVQLREIERPRQTLGELIVCDLLVNNIPKKLVTNIVQ